MKFQVATFVLSLQLSSIFSVSLHSKNNAQELSGKFFQYNNFQRVLIKITSLNTMVMFYS